MSSKILYDDITEQDAILGLLDILSRAQTAERAKDPTFRQWPQMKRLIDHIKTHGINDPWIDVDEQMPDSDLTVQICMPDASDPVWIGYHDGETWRDANGERITSRVTHWKQFPQPPKGDA